MSTESKNCRLCNDCSNSFEIEDCKTLFGYNSCHNFEHHGNDNDIKESLILLYTENARLAAQLKNAVVLPCKVGDSVYADKNTLKHTSNLSQKLIVAKVIGFTVGRRKMLKIGYETLDKNGYIILGYERFPFSAIGKTIFLTKPEALARLKELEVGE